MLSSMTAISVILTKNAEIVEITIVSAIIVIYSRVQKSV